MRCFVTAGWETGRPPRAARLRTHHRRL